MTTNEKTKTAKLILVYQYSRILEYKNSSIASSQGVALARNLASNIISSGRLRLEKLFLDRKGVLSICGGAR